MVERFTASGIAIPVDPDRMLDEICKHFLEHATVLRTGNHVTLDSAIGKAEILSINGNLKIELSSHSCILLQSVRNVIAEHLFMFAGEEPLELSWAEMPDTPKLANFHEVTVVRTTNVTPHMRRVTVSCRNVAPFLDDGLHVRLLIPPIGRQAVWPYLRSDGRIQWPSGPDELVVRIYTIRSVNRAASEMDIDFVQHAGESMPGARWAANARPGDVVGLLGPGGGGVPRAQSMLLAGDETALPAILRIAAEVPTGTTLRIFLEVDGPAEEQALLSAGDPEVSWLHRNGAAAGTTQMLTEALRQAAAGCPPQTFIWVGCERTEAKTIRDFVRNELKQDRQMMSVGAYWERTPQPR